jgi:hypothetical protein
VCVFDNEHDACVMLLGRVCAGLAERNALRIAVD